MLSCSVHLEEGPGADEVVVNVYVRLQSRLSSNSIAALVLAEYVETPPAEEISGLETSPKPDSDPLPTSSEEKEREPSDNPSNVAATNERAEAADEEREDQGSYEQTSTESGPVAPPCDPASGEPTHPRLSSAEILPQPEPPTTIWKSAGPSWVDNEAQWSWAGYNWTEEQLKDVERRFEESRARVAARLADLEENPDESLCTSLDGVKDGDYSDEEEDEEGYNGPCYRLEEESRTSDYEWSEYPLDEAEEDQPSPHENYGEEQTTTEEENANAEKLCGEENAPQLSGGSGTGRIESERTVDGAARGARVFTKEELEDPFNNQRPTGQVTGRYNQKRKNRKRY
ncbi:hypothetical protein L596_007603 [Steinernema carpocapsae]|uniref:Uncharacterized protein n=1 Tax=Steinernema carpocapsae TaxID=34508 RepID=A0A4V6A647_STECR|nr:hypothetical protein L596_007603 [Steinernema carpocapsae]